MSPNASGLLAAGIVNHLVGVIDLKTAQAVHAVAGDRSQYQPVRLSDQSHAGDPIALADHYRNLGINRLYIADLDSIVDQVPQAELLRRIVDHCQPSNGWTEVMIDVGWRGEVDVSIREMLAELAAKHSHLRVIAATESAIRIDSLRELVDLVGAERTLLGMDYRSGDFVAQTATESDWIATAVELKINAAVVLDVAAVGTGDSQAAESLCRRLRQLAPLLTLYCGGGIRSDTDVSRLRGAGCEFCLVATSLHDLLPTHREQ